MALELKQTLRLTQQLVMTPQLQQAIKLLQLSTLELQGVIEQELVENPCLEDFLEDERAETEHENAPATDGELDGAGADGAGADRAEIDGAAEAGAAGSAELDGPMETVEPPTAEEVVGDVDMVLLMTVEPGFGGQSFLPDSCRRCEEVKKLLRDDQRLEVDGGIDMHTAPMVVSAGADTLVAGKAIFGQAGPVRAMQAIQQACLKSQKSKENP